MDPVGEAGCENAPGDDDGENAHPDRQHRDGEKRGCADGAHNVGPDSGAVVQAMEEGEARLKQGAVLRKHNLEVPLQRTAHMRISVMRLSRHGQSKIAPT